MSIRIQKLFSIEDCSNHPEDIYIFGDNLIGRGYGGQAIIRNCHNTFGIPTKRLPSHSEDAYFSDQFDEYEAVKERIEKLLALKFSKADITFVFPEDGLGTGLSKMNIKSPQLFKYMNEQLNKYFSVGY